MNGLNGRPDQLGTGHRATTKRVLRVKKLESKLTTAVDRRQLFQFIGGAGAALLATGGGMPTPAFGQSAFSCVLNPEMTEGPYWVEEKLNRSDIRVDPSDGSVRPGTPLALTINVYLVNGSSCALLPNAYVDIWHCDAGGLYSDVAANSTVGKKFLRGYQVTDRNGAVQFTTVYPGWYSGRAVHIHMRIRTYSGTQTLGTFTSQLFFDDSITDQVYTSSPYNSRGTRNTRNSNDRIYNGSSNSSRGLLTLTQTADGWAGVANVGVNLAVGTAAVSTTTYSLPQFVYGGGWATSLYLANTSDTAATATVRFVGESGSALSVPIAGVGSRSQWSGDLPALGTVALESESTGDLAQGWAEADLPSGVVGYGIFRQTVEGRADQEALVPLAVASANPATVVYDDVSLTTALAVANPSSSSVDVTFVAYRNDGAQIGTGTLTLAARSKMAVSLKTLSGLSGVAGTRGWVKISTQGTAISVLGLRFGTQAFTSIPVANG
jgi:protocatechuate 3,4-dioxygenase beta subunit